MQRINTCLWFDDRAEEAANFYCSIFKNSKISGITRFGKDGAQAARRPEGSVMTVSFELDGHKFLGLNGGPVFKFSPAVSLIVNCETQEEIDHYWAKLSEGGEEGQCAWLTDKFGVSWQIVPSIMGDLMLNSSPAQSENVMRALLQMRKIDIKTLQQSRAKA